MIRTYISLDPTLKNGVQSTDFSHALMKRNPTEVGTLSAAN
jgi:hypothetical protein